MRLQTLLNNFEVVSTGFPAFAGLSKYSKGHEKVHLSTLPAAVLVGQGITEYYAPIIPRDSKFETSEDIYLADIDVQKYKVRLVEDKLDLLSYANPIDTIIVSRHKGTVRHLLGSYHFAGQPKVFDGNVIANDIKGKHVIGTLPPHLVSECDYYTAVSIKDFDYAVDGDLDGKELEDRIIIGKPIQLEKIESEPYNLELIVKDGTGHTLVVDKEILEYVIFGGSYEKDGLSFYNASENSSNFYGSDICGMVSVYSNGSFVSLYVNKKSLYKAHKDFDKFLKNMKVQFYDDGTHHIKEFVIK